MTAEVTPHHLFFTDEVVTSYDPIYKVNPPLRTQKDVEAVRAGLADGTIDIVATDHAPHPAEDKDCEWTAAAFGMTGLESALAIVNATMVKTGLITWSKVAEVMSVNPAKIGRVFDQGQPIQEGKPANIVVFNPNVEIKVDPAKSESGSRNTPYRELTLPGQVVATIFHGEPTVLNGEIAK